jgi:hypothetical protein
MFEREIGDNSTGNLSIAWGTRALYDANGVQQFAWNTSGVESSGDVALTSEGSGIEIKEGSNATMGQNTLVAGNVTVANTTVTAASRIFLTCNAPNAGTPGALYVSARTAATSFTITSTSVLDTCNVAWLIIEPN